MLEHTPLNRKAVDCTLGTVTAGAHHDSTRTVADVISRYVTLEVEYIARMYLNVYQPRLQSPAQVAAYFRYNRGDLFASSAVMSPISEAFIGAAE
jgi:hypothetical protein